MTPHPAAATTTRRPSRLVSTMVAGTVVAASTAVGSTTRAAAHTELVSTAPVAGSRVSGPVDQVTLTFSAPIEPQFANLALTVDGGTPQRLTTRVNDRTVTAATLAPTRAGEQWQVAYRVVAADGHPIGGTLTFSVNSASALPSTGASAVPTRRTPEPALPASRTGSTGEDLHLSGVPRWVVPGIAIAVLVLSFLAAGWGPRLAGRRRNRVVTVAAGDRGDQSPRSSRDTDNRADHHR